MGLTVVTDSFGGNARNRDERQKCDRLGVENHSRQDCVPKAQPPDRVARYEVLFFSTVVELHDCFKKKAIDEGCQTKPRFQVQRLAVTENYERTS